MSKAAPKNTGEQLPSLFDVGFARKGTRMGMRVGLTSAFNIIRNHKGHITVESDIGKGTRFVVQLPIC